MADARSNTTFQISVLKRLWRRLYDAGTLTAAQLLTYATGADAVMRDGTEVVSVSFEGGTTSSEVWYPKEVVICAALDLLDEIDDVDSENAETNTVHADFSRTRIES